VSERSRSRPRPVASRAKSAADSDDFITLFETPLLDSTSSTNIRPRARPIARSKSVKPADDGDTCVLFLCVTSISDITCLRSIDISSGDDAMSVKSSKSTKRYWFFSLPVFLLDLLMSNQCNVN